MSVTPQELVPNKSIYIERVTCPIYLNEIKDSDLYTDDMRSAAIIWYDGILKSTKYKELIDNSRINPSQYLNKIPGMDEICYKYNLFKILNKNQKKDFFPQTFLIPDNKDDLLKELKKKKNDNCSWIRKPGSSYGGKGIEIFQKNLIESQINPSDQTFVVQEYISPYLIDEHKFDLRLHLLITSVEPLALYIFKEGIARFCSEKYEEPNSKNVQNKYQHLTNSSLNCKNTNEFKFIRPATEILNQIEPDSDNLWRRK